MRSFPAADPGVPDARSPIRYLWWIARGQMGMMLTGIGFAVLWWLGQALVPTALGKAIDTLSAHDPGALAGWAAALLGLGAVQALAGVMRHRFAVFSWLSAAYRTVQVTARQATRLGATLPKRLSTGEVVSVGNSDIEYIGSAMEILLRGTGAVVSVVTVTVILLTTSVPLGLVVLIGVPLMAAAVGPLLRPLHRRQHVQRDLQGDLATRAGDIVAGLRVLRGIGGEQVFSARYREESQAVRRAGVKVASVESVLEGAQMLLPGLLIAGVTWLGARFAMTGQITAGQLVAFYGYAVFLIAPLRTLTEAADKITKGAVAAGRVCRILSMEPEIRDQPDLLPKGRPPNHPSRAERGDGASGDVAPEVGGLCDVTSGVLVRQGVFTAVAASTPEEAITIVERLGRYVDADVKLGGTPLAELPIAEVRCRILVADNAAKLFTGRLRDELDLSGEASDEDVALALHTACAEDIVDALPEGLDAHVAESGSEFSGGQRQRLRLARAVLADPEILILVEPTSAVDAHSEARIAERLAKARAGLTTLVCTTSPLVLDRAELVLFVEDGKVRAEGTHRELLDAEPGYRSTVTRGED